MSAATATHSLVSTLAEWFAWQRTASIVATVGFGATLAAGVVTRYMLLSQPTWTDEAAAARMYTQPSVHKVLVGIR